MKLIALLTALPLTLTASAPALAHPGEHHGDVGSTLLHLMSEPDHIALLVAAALAGGLGALWMRRRAARSRSMFRD
jgi:hydrogenase/urease accessory protein HupE